MPQVTAVTGFSDFGSVMAEGTASVELDTSKSSIYVAMLLRGRPKPIEVGAANEARAVRRFGSGLDEAASELRVCYEARPCGYTLQCQLREAGVDCAVVAPSLISDEVTIRDGGAMLARRSSESLS